MRFFKSITYYFFFVLALCIAFTTKAQEQLRPLSGNINYNYVPAKKNSAAKTNSISTMELPFFEDFSYAIKSPYPRNTHWVDSNVYVNTGFPNAPLSIGVATFDGLNKTGYPYNISAPVSSSSQADYLTSTLINLEPYDVNDSDLFFSFYYQAEGKGEAPEPNDSLCLDFYKVRQNKWEKVWGVKGYNPSATDTNFYRVMIPILDTAYLDSAFQFRFRNKATLSGSLDHWHLDYIYLDENRSVDDTSRADITFAYKSSSFLKDYWVMPFQHYLPQEMSTSLYNFIRSNDNDPDGRNTVYNYTVYDISNTVVSNYIGGSYDILPFQTDGYQNFANHANPTFTFAPVPPLSGPTSFTIKHTISIATPTTDVVRQNDTLMQVQTFSDYFAHDDGAAEQGYYLNTYGAKTAVRFRLNVADTLRAVNVYFDPIVDGTAITNSTFRVIVWADAGGYPGSIVYKDSLRNPKYLQGGYNIMPTYTLTSCLPLGAGTYFIGIQQTTNKALNIGFDKNSNHMADLFYDIGSGWTQSAIPGSVMINPIMGCTPTATVGIKEYTKTNSFALYPNPAQNKLYIQSKDLSLENSEVQFVSTFGETVYSTRFESNQAIDISHLTNGVYFVYISGKQVNVTPQKLIISR